MKQCPYCSETITESCTVCPECQSRVPSSAGAKEAPNRSCPYCREEIRGRVSRCPNCEKNLRYLNHRGKIWTGGVALLALCLIVGYRTVSDRPAPVRRYSGSSSVSDGSLASEPQHSYSEPQPVRRTGSHTPMAGSFPKYDRNTKTTNWHFSCDEGGHGWVFREDHNTGVYSYGSSRWRGGAVGEYQGGLGLAIRLACGAEN